MYTISFLNFIYANFWASLCVNQIDLFWQMGTKLFMSVSLKRKYLISCLEAPSPEVRAVIGEWGSGFTILCADFHTSPTFHPFPHSRLCLMSKPKAVSGSTSQTTFVSLFVLQLNASNCLFISHTNIH
jgi:hypothetical protein